MKIAVVIPAHQAAPTVARAVSSAWQQQLAPRQVVVVADRCSDGTAAIARDAGAEVHELALGSPAAARNAALARLDDGIDWVAFLDADDWWLPGWLAAVEAARQRVPDAVLIAGRVTHLFADGQRIARTLPVDLEQRGLDCLLVDPCLTTSAVVVRRQALRLPQAFDERIRACGEDYDLWLDLARRGPLAVASGHHVMYRRGADSEMERTDRFEAMRRETLEIVTRAAQLAGVPESLRKAARAGALYRSAERFLAHGLVAPARRDLRLALQLSPADARLWALTGLSALPGSARRALQRWRRTLLSLAHSDPGH